MSKVSQLFSSPGAYKNAEGVNHAGFHTFKGSLEERYVQMLNTNIIDNTFYADKSELFDQGIELHAEMLNKDVEFFAKAILDARTNGHMRLQPIIGLVFLSTHPNKKYFHIAFKRIIKTPNDLKDFVQICRSGVIRKGLGRTVKRAVNNYLNNLSEYHVLKYPSSRGWEIRDILRITRPRPSTPKNEQLFNYIVNGVDIESLTDLPQIAGYESLKEGILSGILSDSMVMEEIDRYRLPYEAVTGLGRLSAGVWESLMYQMPYMALLGNLNNLQRQGVFDNRVNVDYVASFLGNAENVANSKQLPFRFWSAYNAYMGNTNAWGGRSSFAREQIGDALIKALEASFVNVPDINGNMVIATDISGSMNNPISGESTVRYIDIAGLFTGAFLRKAQDRVKVLPFNSNVEFRKREGHSIFYNWKDRGNDVCITRHDPIMTTAKKIESLLGGGTSLAAPVDYMLENHINTDLFIGITDNEEWHPGPKSIGFWEAWRKYKNMNPKTKAILVNIAPYDHRPAPKDAPDVYFVSGWNSNVVNIVASIASGLDDQIERIRSFEIAEE